jgi:hypothetical protein
MNSFISLEAALEEWFEKPLDELPGDLRERVERAFHSFTWEQLTPEKRRARAKFWDDYHDPAIKDKQRRLWKAAKVERMAKIEEKIKRWEAAGDNEARDLEVKEKTLKKLKRKLQKTTEVFDQVTGSGTRTSKSSVVRKTSRDKELQSDANSLAKAWLKEGRRNFTKEEIAKNLAKSDKWKSMIADRINRILRVQW